MRVRAGRQTDGLQTPPVHTVSSGCRSADRLRWLGLCADHEPGGADRELPPGGGPVPEAHHQHPAIRTFSHSLMQTALSTRSHSSQSLHTFIQSSRLTVTCPVCHGCTVPSCQGADVVRQELETNILDTAHIVFTTLNSAGSQSLLQAAAFKVDDRAGARPTEPALRIGLDTRDRIPLYIAHTASFQNDGCSRHRASRY